MPTGNIVSDKWFIRITLPWQAVELIIKENPKHFEDHTRQLVVSHLGEKTEKQHVHCLVELSQSLQKQSVDKRYKKLFGVSGADYSSKPWDGDMGAGAGSYLFHDKLATVMVQKGFTDEQITEFQRLNADVQKVVEVNKQRASGRCVERVLKIIEESGNTWTTRQIANHLLDDIKTGVMYEPGDYVLKRYIQEIFMKQLSAKEYDRYKRVRLEQLLPALEQDEYTRCLDTQQIDANEKYERSSWYEAYQATVRTSSPSSRPVQQEHRKNPWNS